MKNWIFNAPDARPIPSWHEAMPDARYLGREALAAVPADETGILWWRLGSGEEIANVLPELALGHGQHMVILCDEPNEAVVMQALAAGASGCCNSHAAPEVLKQVALVVGNGGLWIGQSLLQRVVGSTARLLSQRREAERRDDWSALLSDRETEVARRVANGASNKEIASLLSISERTVKAHLTSIFDKLSLRDRLQLSLKINGLSL